jgi:hypothetical protein
LHQVNDFFLSMSMATISPVLFCFVFCVLHFVCVGEVLDACIIPPGEVSTNIFTNTSLYFLLLFSFFFFCFHLAGHRWTGKSGIALTSPARISSIADVQKSKRNEQYRLPGEIERSSFPSPSAESHL